MEEGAPGLIHFSVKAVIDLSDATAKDVLRVLLSGKDALPNFRIVDATSITQLEGLPAEKAVATFGDESVELTEVWIVAKQDNKGYVVNYYAPSQTNGRNTYRYIRGDGAKRGDKAAMTEVNDEHGRISFLV